MRARTLAPLALLVAASGCLAAPEAPPPDPATERPRQTLGLMTSLPIFWAETGDFAERLTGDTEPGWVRQALEERNVLAPLDTLESDALAGLAVLMLAQPRPLAPSENVALDAWVRGGGRLLLFADPLLTAHSRFPIGDKRRPQDVALLSPILRHWGLELLLDDDQPEGARMVDMGGTAIPISIGGRFRKLAGGGCTLSAQDVLAECAIGKGRVVILADAALLDDHDGAAPETGRIALAELARRTFD